MGSVGKESISGGGESQSEDPEAPVDGPDKICETKYSDNTTNADHVPSAVSKFLAGAIIIDRVNPFQDRSEEYSEELQLEHNKSEEGDTSKPNVISGKTIHYKITRRTSDRNVSRHVPSSVLKNKKPTPKPHDLLASSSSSNNNNNANVTTRDNVDENNTKVREQSNAIQHTSICDTSFDGIDSCNNTVLIDQTNFCNSELSPNEGVDNDTNSRSVDGYASLIQHLTMDDKRKKRTNLKNIFPSLLSKQKKKPEVSGSITSEESSGREESGRKIYPHESDTSQVSDQSLSSPEYNLSYVYSPTGPKDTFKTMKTNVFDQHDIQNERSTSSSSSTLVSDGSHEKENLRKRTQIKLLQRKGSLKNDFILGGNKFFSKREKSGRLSAPLTTDFPVDINDPIDTSSAYPSTMEGRIESTKHLITPKPLRLKPSIVLSNVGYSLENPSFVNRNENITPKKQKELADITTSQNSPVSSGNIKVTNTFYHDNRVKPNEEITRFENNGTKNNNQGNTKSLIIQRPGELSGFQANQYEDLISVGAQMKISTTKVMISPKKETDVKNNKEMHTQTLLPQSKIAMETTVKPLYLIDSDNVPVGLKTEKHPIYAKQSYHSSIDLEQSSSYLKPISPVTVLPSKKPKVSNTMKICRPIFLESIPDNSPGNYTNIDISMPVGSNSSHDKIDSLSELHSLHQTSAQKQMYSSPVKIPNTSSPLPPNPKLRTISPSVTNNSEAIYVTRDETAAQIVQNTLTPQKIRNLKNVEAFYWQQLKKIKYAQEHELTQKAISGTDIISDTASLNALADYSNHHNYNRPEVGSSQWRCRSVSPGFSRTSDRRSLSLPRNSDPIAYTNISLNNSMQKENYAFENPVSPQSNPNFVRNSPKRYTIGTTNNITIRRNFNIQPMHNERYEQQRSGDTQQTNNSNAAAIEVDNAIYGVVRRPGLQVNATKVTPIFRRGSLSDSGHDIQYREKRVSFSSIPNQDEIKLNLDIERKYNTSAQRNLMINENNSDIVYRHARQETGLSRYHHDERHNIYGKINRTDLNEGVYAMVRNSQEREQIYASKIPYKSNNIIPVCQDNYGNVFRFPDEVRRPEEVKRSSAADAAKYLISKRVSGANSSAGGSGGRPGALSESESGSEAGEVQRIMRGARKLTLPTNVKEEEWNPDGKNRGDGAPSEGGRGRVARRDDPRRHTLGGDLLRSAPPHSALVRGMDIEPPLPRGYPPPSSAMLFDDDPGIMSEVETASTGFRRGGKQRSSLPVVRTPSKTLERPLGLVFLQYRSETKRALLPNEITSIDTVKALFVRSFPKQLTMEYLDSPLVKIYIHDSSKDMFYELEDLRSHLRDIRDRSVLRLFESADVSGGAFPGALGGAVGMPPSGQSGSGPSSWDQDQNYFSEPEFDSEYHHQHIHKSKVNAKPPAYYMGSGAPSTLPRGGSLMRAYSPASGPPIPADRIKSLPGSADRIHNDGYMSSPERGSRGAYEEPYYTQYVGPPRGSMTPVIDEESGDPSMMEDQYSLYSVKIPSGPRPAVRGAPYEGNRLNAHSEDLQQRMRVEHMERQLANLTGLVQKALQAPGAAQSPRDFSPGAPHFRNSTQDKSVSFEKSVSFSDEPPDMNSPKQHSPQHAERDRLKPVPPPKPKALVGAPGNMVASGGQQMVMMQMDYYSQLKCLQKRCKDLRMEMRNLRRMTLTQAHTMREMICDTFMKFRTATSGGGDFNFHEDSMRLAREEEIYKQEMLKLEADLSDLESTVEQLRGNVINRKTRVNMVDVEKMALVLSKSSKTVADLKVRFPSLHEGMKGMLSNEMEKVVREEKFLKEEPERLELALRRCKKLTGTLVTLKRLASVQEQRLPCDGGRISPGGSGMSMDDQNLHENNSAHSKGTSRGMGCESGSGGLAPLSLGGSISSDSTQRTENALDALLDELQTFARPPSPGGDEEGEESGLLRRLRVCPVSSDAELSPPVAPRGQAAAKPPVPERNPDLLQMAGRRAPPPPPPRTSSRSPLASPAALHPMLSASNSSSCDSVDSQEGVSKTRAPSARHDLLEQRHQELLKKQKALQEQYARLQQIQRGGNSLTVVPPPDLKKTGSESNLISKMGLNMSPAAPISGSLTHLAGTFPRTQTTEGTADAQATFLSTTSKIYETDIL